MRFQSLRTLLFVAGILACHASWGQSSLAEGFKTLPEGARLVIMPLDVELFVISAGGVLEPQAEWTSKALQNMREAFAKRESKSKLALQHLDDRSDVMIEDLNNLHGAVGSAITMHHLGAFKLPTKEGKFNWTLGDSVSTIGAKTGADYALFTYVRDSYASAERVATMVVAAVFGLGLGGGAQYGYASLVDLRTGQVVWFNRMFRGHGDMRDLDGAKGTLDALLDKFPG